MIDRVAFTHRLSDIPKAERASLPIPPALRRKLAGAPKDRLRLVALVVVPFLLVWFGAILAGASGSVMVLIGVGFAYWFLLGNRLINREVERLKNMAVFAMVPHGEPDEVTVTAEGIARRHRDWTIWLGWPLFTGVSEGRAGLYVWMGPKHVIHVPDSALSEGVTRADLRAAVESWGGRS